MFPISGSVSCSQALFSQSGVSNRFVASEFQINECVARCFDELHVVCLAASPPFAYINTVSNYVRNQMFRRAFVGIGLGALPRIILRHGLRLPPFYFRPALRLRIYFPLYKTWSEITSHYLRYGLRFIPTNSDLVWGYIHLYQIWPEIIARDPKHCMRIRKPHFFYENT